MWDYCVTTIRWVVSQLQVVVIEKHGCFSMNEHGFIQAVHRRLPGEVHCWKINARFVRGVPDAWYSGSGGDVWVEYKFLPSHPVKQKAIGLSANQRHWLNARWRENRNVGVIVGTPKGAFVLTEGDWARPIDPTQQPLLSHKEAAQWIEQQTLST